MWKAFSVLTIIMTIYGLMLTGEDPATVEYVVHRVMMVFSAVVIFGYAFDKNVLPRKTSQIFAWVFSGYLIISNLVFIARLYEKLSVADISLGTAIGAFVIGAGINIEWLAVWRYGNGKIEIPARAA